MEDLLKEFTLDIVGERPHARDIVPAFDYLSTASAPGPDRLDEL
jgi:hypothetical protein